MTSPRVVSGLIFPPPPPKHTHTHTLLGVLGEQVDVCNQAILGWGLREASKRPDKEHQYGYGRAAFFYSLLTALSTFGFGALYTRWAAISRGRSSHVHARTHT